MSKHNPYDMFIDEKGNLAFYGEDYVCDLEIGCNAYSYDFKGNVTKLNDWWGYGDLAFDYYSLEVKEKDGNAILYSCFNTNSEPVCNPLNDIKVLSIYNTNFENLKNGYALYYYIIERYNPSSNKSEIGVYNSKGEAVINPSSDFTVLNKFSEYNPNHKMSLVNVFHVSDEVIILKNNKTGNFHFVAKNGKEEVLTLDAIKSYGLEESNITDLEISLSDSKNIYHIDRKIFGDLNGVFSKKEYKNAYANKLVDEFVIIDSVNTRVNIYKTDGSPIIEEDKYRFLNEEAMEKGLLVLYDKKGNVVVRDKDSLLFEQSLGLDEDYIGESELYGKSLIIGQDIYFIGYQYDGDEPVANKLFVLKEDGYSYQLLNENKKFEIDSSKFVTFKIDGDFKLFKEIYIDGKLVNAKNYNVKEGSTIITLNNDYAKKLADGKEHTVKVVYTNNKEVSMSFTVEEKIENPRTGQTISIVFIAGLICIGVFVNRNKKINVLNKI